MRDGFREIVSGWIYDGFEMLGDRIEAAADWTKANGPLEQDEEATVKLMIESQVAKSIRLGMFEPYIHGDEPDDEDFDDSDPGITDRERL